MASHQMKKQDDISELAQRLARDCVVTQALGTYLEHVLRAVYDDEIAPLRAALVQSRAALYRAGFVGPSSRGTGDPEINAINAALGE